MRPAFIIPVKPLFCVIMVGMILPVVPSVFIALKTRCTLNYGVTVLCMALKLLLTLVIVASIFMARERSTEKLLIYF